MGVLCAAWVGLQALLPPFEVQGLIFKMTDPWPVALLIIYRAICWPLRLLRVPNRYGNCQQQILVSRYTRFVEAVLDAHDIQASS